MLKLNEYILKNRNSINKPNIEYAWYDEMYINTKASFYDVPTVDGVKRVFAFISYPETKMPDGGYPAIILIHGGNGAAYHEMSKLWSVRGYVVIAPDFNGKYAKKLTERGLDNPYCDIHGYGSFNDYKSKNPWAYFSVLSAMRAIDVLCTDPLINKNLIFSIGLSWGGFINLLFLSVEKRIKAASIIYSSAYISSSKWAHMEHVSNDFKDDEWKIYDEYIDPQTYLKNIICPVLFTAGADDIAFTMENRRKTAAKIPSKTYFAYRNSFPHANFFGFEQKESDLFFKSFIYHIEFENIEFDVEDKLINLKNKNDKAKYYLNETKEHYSNSDTLIWTRREITNNAILLDNETKTYFIEKVDDIYTFSSNVINL